MHFFYTSHRNALELLENNPSYLEDWYELKSIIENITDEKLISYFTTHSDGKNKSLSVAINRLLKDELVENGWQSESPIFQDPRYIDDKWRLDFAKNKIAIEVAFNHGEATAWNLIKPNLSGELNHVKKAIQTEIGVIITATDELKAKGGFDSAVGSYEKFLTYLQPMRNMLSVPMLIIGLNSPENFVIRHEKRDGKKVGIIESLKLKSLFNPKEDI